MGEMTTGTSGVIRAGTNNRNTPPQGAALHWVHWLVIAFSLLLTIVAWYISSDQIKQKNRLEFMRQTEQVVDLVVERMQLYENALWGGVALMDANQGNVDYPTWKQYADSLNIDAAYPGINGIGVIYYLPVEEREAYLAEQHKLRPEFKIHPQHSRAELWPITYIEPVKPNLNAVGLDIAFEDNRYTAVAKARDTGRAQVTGPIILVQDAKKTPGFLFYAPFYKNGAKPETTEARRKEVVGATYAPFIMSKLMRGTLATANRQVHMRISDGGEELYMDQENSVQHASDIDPAPLFTTVVDMPVYGRTWQFEFESGRSFRAAHSSSQPLFILLGGIVIDILLLLLFVTLGRSTRRALTYADEVTADLRARSAELSSSNDKLEQRTRKMQELLQALEQNPQMIFITDPDGVIRYANRYFYEETGFEEKDVIGQTPRILKSGFTPQETYRDLWGTISNGKIWKGELYDRRKDGSCFWSSVFVAPLYSSENELTGYCSTHEDVTERKEMEQTLEKARTDAEIANKAKSEFLSNMSHEIRTPMNGIIMSLDLSLRNSVPAEVKSLIETASSSAHSLLTIINDILDVAKLESGKLTLKQESFSLSELFHGLANLMSPVAAAKGLEFNLETTADLPEWVSGDQVRIGQILSNLVNNAIKFTAKGKVELLATYAKTDPRHGRLKVRVIDTGCGIPLASQKILFKRFSQVHSNDGTTSGTGLGLAICHDLVRLMGGEIGVESDGQFGSEFWFEIPLTVSQDPSLAEEQDRLSTQKGYRILVAEDNEINRMLVQKLLTKSGHQVDLVENGEEAVRALLSDREYDLVLMDIRMPVLNGLDATRKIRSSDHANSQIPILALTADALVEQQNEYFATGMDGFVGKPVQFEELLSEIERVTRRKDQMRPPFIKSL